MAKNDKNFTYGAFSLLASDPDVGSQRFSCVSSFLFPVPRGGKSGQADYTYHSVHVKAAIQVSTGPRVCRPVPGLVESLEPLIRGTRVPDNARRLSRAMALLKYDTHNPNNPRLQRLLVPNPHEPFTPHEIPLSFPRVCLPFRVC